MNPHGSEQTTFFHNSRAVHEWIGLMYGVWQ